MTTDSDPYAPPRPISSAPPQSSGLALAALITGIISMVTCGVICLLPIIFGHISLAKIKRSNGALGGRGMALWGMILGYVSILFLAGVVVLQLFAFRAVDSGLQMNQALKIGETQFYITQANTTVDQFRKQHQRLPSSHEELKSKGRRLPYPNDAWGNPLRYDVAAGTFYAESPDGLRIDLAVSP